MLLTIIVLLVASADAESVSRDAARCSIVLGESERRLSSADMTRRTVDAAEVIVRARAVRELDTAKVRRLIRPDTRVHFDVLEVVKGTFVDSAVVLEGSLVLVDEFNGGAVPYESPRRSALSGACFAYRYRAGGEYALLLKRDEAGVLTPYWAALQPVNEQLRGLDDPWLVWLRERSRTGSAR